MNWTTLFAILGILVVILLLWIGLELHRMQRPAPSPDQARRERITSMLVVGGCAVAVLGTWWMLFGSR